MAFGFKSIRSRFLAIHVPILLVSFVGILGVAEWTNYKADMERLESSAHTLAASQSIILAAAVADKDLSRIRAAVASAISNPEVRGIAVYGEDGGEIDAYGAGYDEPGKLTTTATINFADETGVRTVGRLAVAMNAEPIVKRTQQRLLYGIGFGLAAIVAALVAAQIALGRIVATPLSRLLDVIEQTGGGGERATVEWSSRDEMGRVVEAYNKLQRRERANEQALAEINETLEARVRDRTQDLDRARREAVKANKAKSEFLANMSHELRTPLNSVLGFTQILRTSRSGEWNEKDLDHLVMIEKSGEILLRLIDQVLDLNKIEAGALMIEVEDVPLSNAIEQSVGIVTAQAEKAGVLIDVNIESFVDISVKADPLRLRQVLLNLLSNAIKYNRAGGRVGLRAGASEGKVRIVVSDTGIGIAESDIKRAFEAFNRLDQDIGAISGAGLGLTISQRLVEMMGGSIDVESKVGEGSTFTVTLNSGERLPLTRDFIRLQA